MAVISRNWQRIVIAAIVVGLIATLIADFGEWDRFLDNLLWRILIVALGGAVGLVFNFFGSGYVAMGTNVIESMRITRFGSDTHQKIENSFVYMGVFVAAVLSVIFIK